LFLSCVVKNSQYSSQSLVREDGKEDDVFALIGPKRYDVPWKTLESKGFIAEAICLEYRLLLPPKEELEYAHAPKRQRFRIAAENSKKLALVEELICNHSDDSILVIGQYQKTEPADYHRQDQT